MNGRLIASRHCHRAGWPCGWRAFASGAAGDPASPVGGDCCCCKEVVGRRIFAQSTVSQHLKVLVDAGLVRVKADRQRSLLRVDRAALADGSARWPHWPLVAARDGGGAAADVTATEYHKPCRPPLAETVTEHREEDFGE